MGGIVMHSCDRPACINPAHLIMGTTQDNVDDKISKGRHRQGAELLSAKLTELDVQAIRVAYIPRHPEFNQHALARRYGVSQRTVAKVLHGVSYKGKQ
jgi:DNA-binding transcriptional regulator YiaG